MNEEQTIFRGSPSLLTRFGSLFLASLVLVGAALAALLLPASVAAPARWAAGAGAALALLYLLGVVILNRSTQYEVTTQRIRLRRGILTKRTDEMELYRTIDATLVEPFNLRMFGLGTVELRTSDATTPIIRIEAVRGARKLREELRQHIEDCRDRKRVRMAEIEQAPSGDAPSAPAA